nr:macrophage mannose receptor 1-like [Misgurnus anguillicaudatus]
MKTYLRAGHHGDLLGHGRSEDLFVPWRLMELPYRWLRPVLPLSPHHGILVGSPRIYRCHRRNGVTHGNLRSLSRSSCSPAAIPPPKMALINARSLVNKTFLLNDFFTSHSLDFMFITESWTKDNDEEAGLGQLDAGIVIEALRQQNDSSFLIYNEDHKRCVNVINANVIQTAPCDVSSNAQRFRWISSSRVISVSLKLCLEAQNVKDSEKVILLPCEELSPLQTWECKNETVFGLKGQPLHLNYDNQDKTGVMLFKGNGSWSRWQIFGTTDNLCSHGYQEIYTLGGNSFGKPCQFPFKFNDKWFTECTMEGRSDSKLWCSTETDYDTEKKWGLCPDERISRWDSDPVTGVLYQRNTQSALTWHQARASCQQQDADLLSISELHEQSYISGLTDLLGSALWIGLNSLDFESGWQWSNGNPFRYLNWAPGNPSLEPGLNCAALNAGKASKWESLACSKKLGYICRKGNSTDITPSTGKDQPNFCPVAWVLYAGHCYYLQRTNKTWSDALTACHREGSDLASIHNIEEHSFIISQTGYMSTDELWIGLNDQRIQNLFEWSDRSHVTFTKWFVGEPSHITNRMEDCVLIRGQEGKWSDHLCESVHGFICKKKASIKPEVSPEVISPGCPAM